MDKAIQVRIYDFLKEKILYKKNPRAHGKVLKGNKKELWRYRIGDYRIICHLDDDTVTVLVVTIDHRKNIYQNK